MSGGGVGGQVGYMQNLEQLEQQLWLAGLL